MRESPAGAASPPRSPKIPPGQAPSRGRPRGERGEAGAPRVPGPQEGSSRRGASSHRPPGPRAETSPLATKAAARPPHVCNSKMQSQQYLQQRQKFAAAVLAFIFILAAVDTAEAGKKEKPEKKVKKSDCGEWQWSVCVPSSGDCGLGTREGTRTGAECKQTMKTQRCKIPCNWKKQFGGKSHPHWPVFHSNSCILLPNIFLRLTVTYFK